MPRITNATLSDVTNTSARVAFRVEWAPDEREAGTVWDLLVTFWGEDDSIWDRRDNVLRRFGRPFLASGAATQDESISFAVPDGTFDEDLFGDEVYAVVELLPVPRGGASARTNVVRGRF